MTLHPDQPVASEADRRAGDFAISVEMTGEGTCIHLVGELDIASEEPLIQTIADLEIDEGDEIVLDCSGLEFVDSSGLRQVIRLHKTAAAASANLTVLIAPNSPIRKTMTISGLDDILTIRDAEADDAVND